MIGVFLLPFMFIVLAILFRIVRNYLKSIHLDFVSFVAAVFLFGGLACVVTGFFIPSGISPLLSGIKRELTRLGFYWMGIMLYFLMGLLLCGSCLWAAGPG